MPATERDQSLENGIGLLLRTGVLLACGVMAAGAILYLLREGGERQTFARFQGEPPELESFSGIVKEAASGTARGIIQLGLLILIATPVMRVVFAMLGFAWEKDFRFVTISLAVLGLLAYGLFGQH